jgi:hypothetical protein
MRTRSLSGVTTASVGTAINFHKMCARIAMQVHSTGEPTGGQVILEGTIDGTNYFRLGAWRAGADANDVPVVADEIPCIAARAQCIDPPSGGTSPTFSADIAYV